MSMIEFIKKHEKVLQKEDSGKDSYRRKLVSLEKKIEDLASLKPDYQKIANEICKKLKEKNLLPEIDDEIKVGDRVTGMGDNSQFAFARLEGSVLGILDPQEYPQNYCVEWDKNIDSGSSCDGKGKWGYCNYLNRKGLTKVDSLKKTTVNSRKDYNDFLESIFEENEEEYLDYDDKDFGKGDVVEVEFDFELEYFGLAKGSKVRRGAIINKVELGLGSSIHYNVNIDGEERLTSLDDIIAKVKKRKINVGDEVEVVNAPDRYIVKDDSWGHVVEIRNSFDYGVLYFINFEDIRPEGRKGSQLISIEKEFLRLKGNIDKETERKINLVIKNVGEDFELPEFEDKAYELSKEILQLSEKRILPEEKADKYLSLDIFASLDSRDKKLDKLSDEGHK